VNTWKRVLAAAFGALVGVSLAKYVSDTIIARIVWGIVSGFVGFIAYKPIVLWQEFQKQKKQLFEYLGELDKQRHIPSAREILIGELYNKHSKNYLMIVPMIFIVIFWVGLPVNFIMCWTDHSQFNMMNHLISVSGLGLLVVLIFMTSNDDRLLVNSYDSEGWIQRLIQKENEKFQERKKELLATIFLPIVASYQIAKFFYRNYIALGLMFLLALAKACKKVTMFSHWCVVAGSVIGYATGIFFSHNELVAMVVAGLIAEGVYFLALLLEKILPSAQTPWPEFA